MHAHAHLVTAEKARTWVEEVTKKKEKKTPEVEMLKKKSFLTAGTKSTKTEKKKKKIDRKRKICNAGQHNICTLFHNP